MIGIRVEFSPQVHLQNMLVGTDAAVGFMSRKRTERKYRGKNGRGIVFHNSGRRNGEEWWLW